jgi:hypothetical protein
MSCEQCREREAVIHLTQIVNEQVTTLHLCERCAAEKGVESPGSQPKTPLGTFLAAMGQELPEQTPTTPRTGELLPVWWFAPGLPGKRPAGVPRLLSLLRGAAPGSVAPSPWLHSPHG